MSAFAFVVVVVVAVAAAADSKLTKTFFLFLKFDRSGGLSWLGTLCMKKKKEKKNEQMNKKLEIGRNRDERILAP